MDQTKKRRGFRIFGWAMIAWTVVDIGLCILSLLEANVFTDAVDTKVRTFLLVATCAVVGFDAVFSVMAGIAGIKANFKLGKAALIGLSIGAAVFLIGKFATGDFGGDDLRYALIPVLFAAFMYPAKGEAEANKL